MGKKNMSPKMINEPSATMFIFAGNNGSGKSTIRNLIIDRIGVSVNIDPDALARRLNQNPLKVLVFQLAKRQSD